MLAAIQVPATMPTAQPISSALRIEPARIEAEDHRREGLDDPDAAQQLHLDGVFVRQEDDEHQRADLHHQRHDLRHLRIPAPGVQSGLMNSR